MKCARGLEARIVRQTPSNRLLGGLDESCSLDDVAISITTSVFRLLFPSGYRSATRDRRAK